MSTWFSVACCTSTASAGQPAPCTQRRTPCMSRSSCTTCPWSTGLGTRQTPQCQAGWAAERWMNSKHDLMMASQQQQQQKVVRICTQHICTHTKVRNNKTKKNCYQNLTGKFLQPFFTSILSFSRDNWLIKTYIWIHPLA